MSFEWLPLVPLWAVFLLALLGAGLLAVSWRAMRGTEARRTRVLLVVFRALVLLFVLLALLGPAFTSEEDPEGSRTLALLLDTSKTMSITDGPNGASRLAEAALLADTVRKAAADDFDVRTWCFDEDVRPLGPDAARANGQATHLRRAVERFAAGGARAATVVVFSDGIETGSAAETPLASPVYAVPVGTDLRTVPNVGFGRVEIPETLDVGTKGTVRAEIVVGGDAAFRASLKRVALGVEEDGASRVVDTLDLSGGGVVPVSFEIDAAKTGFKTVKLSLPVAPGEVTGLDNERLGVVEVKDPDFRVLYASSRLDQEFRTIRREAAGMPGVDLTGVIEVSPGRFVVQGERPGDDLDRGLPADPAALRRFHAIVLGGFPAAGLPGAVQSALRTWVEQGGGLVWLGADDGFGRGGWASTPLMAISPLAFGTSDPPPVSQGLPVLVAPEAANHPLARALAHAFEGLDHPLPLEGIYRFGSTVPGSQVVLIARGPEGRDLPVLATRDVGKGRVVVLGSSTFFRWRTVGGAPAAAYAALWRQVLRYAASRSEERSRLSVSADKDVYRPGDVAVVTATVRGPDLEPTASGSVGGTLLGLDGKEIRSVDFQPSANEKGVFTTRVKLPHPQTLRLSVWATDGQGGASEREVLLRVGGEREGERCATDEDALRRIAESTGGRVFPPERIDDLVQRLTARDRLGRTLVTHSPLHDGPWGFLVLFVLALADWIVRRTLRKI